MPSTYSGLRQNVATGNMLMSVKKEQEDNRSPTVYLLDWRKALGFTQTQLADRMKRHHTHVLNKEKTKRGMTLQSLCEFADGLGIPWHLLLQPPPANLESFVEKLNPDDVEELIRIISEVAGGADVSRSDNLTPPEA